MSAKTAASYKPYPTRTLEDELAMINTRMSHTEDEGEKASYGRLISQLENELRFANSPEGEPYYKKIATGVVRHAGIVKVLLLSDITIDPVIDQLFPPLPDQEFEDLKSSISKIGLLNPLIVSQDNVLLCGHNRYRAAKALGVNRVDTLQRYCASPEYSQAIAVSDNLVRRHLAPKDAFKAFLAMEAVMPLTLPGIAENLNLSLRSAQRYKLMAEKMIPELKEFFVQHGINLDKAEVFARLSEDLQRQVLRTMQQSQGKASEPMIQEIRDQLTQKEKELKETKKKVDSLRDEIDVKAELLNDRSKQLAEVKGVAKQLDDQIVAMRKREQEFKAETQNTNEKLRRYAKDEEARKQMHDPTIEKLYEVVKQSVQHFKSAMMASLAAGTLKVDMAQKWGSELTEQVKKLEGAIAKQ